METMNKEKQESSPGDFVTLGKRWERNASLINQKRVFKLKWLQSAEKIQGKLLPLKHYVGESTKKWINQNPIDQNPYKINLIESSVQDQEPKTHSEIDKKKDNSEQKAEGSSYIYLDSDLKNFLAGILNIRIPTVKIYANQTSDSLTKQFNADALTYENRIFFKTGKYDPRDKRGIALLGHELTHAAQIKMQNRNLPEPTVTDYSHEEREAIDNEKRVLSHFSSVEPYGGKKDLLNQNSIDYSLKDYNFDSGAHRSFESPVSLDIPGNSTSSSKSNNAQIQAPRTALTSRDLNFPSETNAGLNSGFQLSEQQFRMIKDEIYRDIMNRIRTEFERGG